MHADGGALITPITTWKGTLTFEDSDAILALAANTPVDPHLISGATISGPGTFRVGGNNFLEGFGTISSQLNGLTGSEIFAKDGILSINGAVSSQGTLGTKSNGELNFGSTFNTSSVSELILNGGKTSGKTILNAGTTRVTASSQIESDGLDNDGTLLIEAGTLTVDSVNSIDLDGPADTGTLALSDDSDLTLLKELSDDFGSNITLGDNSDLTFTDEARFDPGSQIELNTDSGPSNVAAIHATTLRLAGALDIDGYARIVASCIFESTSSLITAASSAITLEGNIDISSGSTFEGPGTLIIKNGNALLRDGSFLNKSISLNPTTSIQLGKAVGTARMKSLTVLNATIHCDILDASGQPNDNDHLFIDDNIHFSGTLEVNFQTIPANGQTWRVISYGSHSGFLTQINVTDLPEGFTLTPVYNSDGLDLVVQEPGGSTYANWQLAYAPTNPDVMNPENDTDGDGLANGLEYVLGSNPLEASPEAHPRWTTVQIGPNTHPGITFDLPDGANFKDAIIEVEKSTDLINWTTESVNPRIDPENPSAPPETYYSTFILGVQKEFLRLKVGITP